MEGLDNPLETMEIPVLESLCNTAKTFQAVRLATLLKRDAITGISEPVFRRCSTK